MGKINGTISFTGKLGETVGMKGMDGQTYIRKNTVPANPKSKAQVEQRVKMSLAGLLSKITPASLLVGLDSDRRKRRMRFTSNIARNAVTTVIDGATTAKLDPSLLVFSEGVFMPTPQVTAAFSGTTLTLTPAEAPSGDVSALLAIAVFANLDDGTYAMVNGGFITGADPITLQGTGTSANVYIIPVGRAEGATYVSYRRVIDRIAENPYDYAAVAEASSTGSVAYGASRFNGTVNQG